MRKKERNYEVKINGIPQLKDMPKDLLDLLCAALLEGTKTTSEQRGTTQIIKKKFCCQKSKNQKLS